MSSGNGNYMIRNVTIVCFTIYNTQAYYTKEDEMGGTLNTYVEKEKCLQNCSQERLSE
jgi:hypothetical protein